MFDKQTNRHRGKNLFLYSSFASFYTPLDVSFDFTDASLMRKLLLSFSHLFSRDRRQEFLLRIGDWYTFIYFCIYLLFLYACMMCMQSFFLSILCTFTSLCWFFPSFFLPFPRVLLLIASKTISLVYNFFLASIGSFSTDYVCVCLILHQILSWMQEKSLPLLVWDSKLLSRLLLELTPQGLERWENDRFFLLLFDDFVAFFFWGGEESS